ncbi:hypothetical protein ASD42_18640 [Nocardia sp. Root136]|uniref:hypothetical protein n=1 Tax=Nocardia salmonicida TaxID=53431 RepID=UPI0006FC3944|nr:hypothetical protein ASD42_18640 [Nocardia sp. Root136]
MTACDIAYFDNGVERVAANAIAEAARGNEYVREHADSYRWTFFADPDEHRRARRESAHCAKRSAIQASWPTGESVRTRCWSVRWRLRWRSVDLDAGSGDSV